MTGQTQRVRFLLIGAGNVGRRFLGLVESKGSTLRDRLGLESIQADCRFQRW
jgi:homoserine dehydrogenase